MTLVSILLTVTTWGRLPYCDWKRSGRQFQVNGELLECDASLGQWIRLSPVSTTEPASAEKPPEDEQPTTSQ